jgi:predicted O-methyltransferase YrrM
LKYFYIEGKGDPLQRNSFYIESTLEIVEKTLERIYPLTIESIVKDRFLCYYHFSLLYSICHFLKPEIVVETGIGPGLSTTFILKALKDNNRGKLYSIDLPEIDVGYLVPDLLKERWITIRGKSEETLPELMKRIEKVDLFFHDSEHTYENMMREYQIVWPHIRNDGILMSHDINWNNAFADFSNQIDRDSIIIDPEVRSKSGIIIR